MPGLSSARPAAQQSEALVQAIEQLGHGHALQPRNGEFDGQWHAVEARAQLDHGPLVLGSDREVTHHVPCTVHEQGNRFEAFKVLNRMVVLYGGCRQGRHGIDRLAGHAQGLTAGGEDPHPRGRGQDTVHQLPGPGQHVFTVVEEQQQLLVLQVVRHSFQRPAIRLVLNGQGGGDYRADGGTGVEGSQIHHPRTVAKMGLQALTDFHPQAGFAHASGTREGRQPRAGHRGPRFLQFPATSHE